MGFVVAAWVAAALTPLVRALARRVGAVDKPDDYRKTDRRAVPLLGGIAVFAAFPVPIVALTLFHRNNVAVLVEQHWPQVAALLAGGAIALGLGIVDDVMQLSARWKLLCQVAAAGVAVAGGFCVTAISNPFGGSIVLGWLGVPVTILWFIGCMNALNLLDGLDGLAAGVGLFVAVTLLLVSSVYGNGLAMLLLACLAGATAGFLRYNFHPATIFLGDSGSMLLGFWVAALSLLAARKAEAAVALLVPFIALGLPIFDTTLAILRRWSRNLPISAADRQHIHHRLLAMGLTHRRAVLVLYVACAALGAAALLISAGRGAMTLIVVGSLALLAFVCIRAMGTLRLNDLVGRLSRDWATGRRSAQARVAVEKARHLIRSAPDVTAAWNACRDAFCAMDLDHAELQVLSAGLDGGPPYLWSRIDGRSAATTTRPGRTPGASSSACAPAPARSACWRWRSVCTRDPCCPRPRIWPWPCGTRWRRAFSSWHPRSRPAPACWR